MSIARARLAPLVVLAASALLVAGSVTRGWIPHDEGMLGQTAERMLLGELPHADFDDVYSGGLTALHALTFRVFGVRLTALRWLLFAIVLAWVPLLYAIARRWLAEWPAVLVTLVAVAWSVPNYFASMPSWYVLFAAVAGVWALLRARETSQGRWLFLAGLFAGLALTVKVVGLYFAAAALLYLAFREQDEADARGRAGGSVAFFVLQVLGVAAFMAVLLALVHARRAPKDVVQLVVPAAAVSTTLLIRAWSARRNGTFRTRMSGLWALVAPFVAGVALPVGLLLLPFVLRGASGDLYRGLWVRPFRQIAATEWSFPPLWTAATVLPYALILSLSFRGFKRGGRALAGVLVVASAVVLIASSTDAVYRAVFDSARSLGIVAVLVGCTKLVAEGRRGEAQAGEGGAPLFLLLSAVAMLSLLQYPYAAPIYFCYTAPLVALALAALVPRGAGWPNGVVAVFYLVFAVVRLHPGYVGTLGVRPERYGPLAKLDLPLAGLDVPREDRDTYTRLVAKIQERSRGPYVYAAPDCPEVSFLAGRRNPTRVVFDYAGEAVSPEALVRLLREKMVTVAVLNERPDYSRPLDAPVREALEREFPRSERIGKFVLRWRD